MTKRQIVWDILTSPMSKTEVVLWSVAFGAVLVGILIECY